MAGWLADGVAALRGLLADLAGLVLPTSCGGCQADSRTSVCETCASALSAAVPGPAGVWPAPAGLPPCTALGPYQGILRELILAYKERGRHDLARPLGGLLAAVVSAGSDLVAPLALVPVPATGAAARQRYGDHMMRLAGHAASTLRAAGWPASVRRPLRALPRPDSAGLDSAGRARAAAGAFRVRPRVAAALRGVVASGGSVVLLDDIVTTGATLAAVADRLAAAEVPVARAAVLAATQRHMVRAESHLSPRLGESARTGLTKRGDAGAYTG